MLLRQLFDEPSYTYTYLLADPITREAVLIDPVLEQVPRDAKLIQELGLTLVYTLDTHVHADHITASDQLRTQLGSQTAVGAASGVPCADRLLQDGEILRFGAYEIEARATPGHTSGCMTFVVHSDDKTYAFTGDALLIRGCGRTDFQQGDPEQLYQSVHTQIFSLPPETVICPGHDYRGHRESTVKEEREHNPRLRNGIEQDAFVDIMRSLKLSSPKRMDTAVPANLACGQEKPLATDIDGTSEPLLPGKGARQ